MITSQTTCPTIQFLTSYWLNGVIHRLWVWPYQIDSQEPISPSTQSEIDWVIASVLGADGRPIK